MVLLDKTIVSLFAITILANSSYAIIAPFLPFEFLKKDLSQHYIGYIFSIYSVAVVLCSPIIGKLIIAYGRRKMIAVGILLMGISLILLAII